MKMSKEIIIGLIIGLIVIIGIVVMAQKGKTPAPSMDNQTETQSNYGSPDTSTGIDQELNEFDKLLQEETSEGGIEL